MVSNVECRNDAYKIVRQNPTEKTEYYRYCSKKVYGISSVLIDSGFLKQFYL